MTWLDWFRITEDSKSTLTEEQKDFASTISTMMKNDRALLNIYNTESRKVLDEYARENNYKSFKEFDEFEKEKIFSQEYIDAKNRADSAGKTAVFKKLNERDVLQTNDAPVDDGVILPLPYTSKFNDNYRRVATYMMYINEDLLQIYNDTYDIEVDDWTYRWKADFKKDPSYILSDPRYSNMSEQNKHTLMEDHEITRVNAHLKAIDAVIEKLFEQKKLLRYSKPPQQPQPPQQGLTSGPSQSITDRTPNTSWSAPFAQTAPTPTLNRTKSRRGGDPRPIVMKGYSYKKQKTRRKLPPTIFPSHDLNYSPILSLSNRETRKPRKPRKHKKSRRV